jgi:3-oxoacyl-[acyl-carrier-protein] synthase II
MRPAVVTGVGCVSPIGIGFEAFCRGIASGRSGVRAVSLFDASPYQCRVAAEVSGFDPHEFMDGREAKVLPRVTQFAVAAARLAVGHAELKLKELGARAAIVLGTSSGPIGYVVEQHAVFLERGVRRMHPSSLAYAHNSVIASECAIQLGVHGPVLSMSSACTSSADAIGFGILLLEAGMADIVIAGGAEAPLTPSLFGSFDRLGMLPSHFNEFPMAAPRPFSVDREGPVLGEGAAVLVLETEAHARARGVGGLGKIVGYGATCDADSHFRQSADGKYAVIAIEQALARAGVSPRQVDYVNAHGTGTPENDPFEAEVILRCFGDAGPAVPVSSSKSQFGHLLGAAAAIELAAVLAAMKLGVLPATLNLEQPDPQCGLNHVTAPGVPREIHVALSTSFGFGSRNGALVVERCHG